MTRRPLDVKDLYRLKQIEDPRLSPDGRWVVYVRVDVDEQSNGYQRNLWLSPADGEAEARQLTFTGKDSHPRWSPDGETLVFLSSRGEKPQIYRLVFEHPGGEAQALTALPNGVSGFSWSPDGSQFALLSGLSAEERAGEAPIDDKTRTDPRIVTRIPYRVGTSYLGDRYTQVFVVDAVPGASPRRLTDVNTNHQTPEWSQDGTYLFTARAMNIEADEPFRQSRLYRIRIADGVNEQFTDDAFADVSPLVSPDGQWLAYNRYPQDNMSMSIGRLTAMPVGGGEAHDLNLELDLQPSQIRWAGEQIYFSAQGRGAAAIYRVSPQDGKVEAVIDGDRKAEVFDVLPDGTIAFVASTPMQPQELYLYRPGGETKALTDFNRDLLDEVTIQPAHRLVFNAPDGTEIEGWYMLPHGYEEGSRVPLVLDIHGGPHFMYGPSEETMWHQWQVFAAGGYAVFYCNPRGSAGYGDAFQKSIRGNWGEIVHSDLMAGVDAVLQLGFADPERLVVTGGSFGGFMTAWIVSHTDRFGCALAERGVYNLISHFATCDIPSFVANEFDVDPVKDGAFLWEQSPLAHAHRIKTPLMIIHSENDYRVSIAEAEQLFAFVRRSGGMVQFVRYPREGHELSRSGEPHHRADRLQRMLGWFDTYCR